MKRILKNNDNIQEINPGDKSIHPLTLNISRISDKPICLTKYIFENNLKTINNYTCNYNINTYNDYMYIPPIGITYKSLLNIYKINSIESLKDYIDENINLIPYISLNRILICWIHNNINDIKNHNNMLIDIYLKLINKILIINKINIDIDILASTVSDYIKYWLNNKYSINNDLLYDFIKYFNKKFKYKIIIT